MRADNLSDMTLKKVGLRAQNMYQWGNGKQTYSWVNWLWVRLLSMITDSKQTKRKIVIDKWKVSLFINALSEKLLYIIRLSNFQLNFGNEFHSVDDCAC